MSYREKTISTRIQIGVTPIGICDGVNDTFSVAQAYCPGTLNVQLNGQQYPSANIREIGPSYTSFQIVGDDNLPDSTDAFCVSYLLQS